MKKSLCLVLILMLVLTLFAGCGKKAESAASYPAAAPMANGSAGGYAKDSYDYAYEAEPAYAEVDNNYANYDEGGYGYDSAGDSAMVRLAADAGRKLIWNGSMEMETLEYEQSEEALFRLVEECGGYIESSDRSGGNVDRYSGQRSLRYGYFTVRVPAEKFQYFINAGGSVATVLSTSTGSEDVTDRYFDVEARLAVLKVKEERLLDMLEQGDELEYLIQIERELADTRYEIENLTGTLRRYDGLISYSTVSVSLREVSKPTQVQEPDPLSVWDRIAARFKESLSGIWDGIVECFIFIIGYSPILILTVIVVIVVVVLVRIPGRKRRKQERAAKEAAEQTTQDGPRV